MDALERILGKFPFGEVQVYMGARHWGWGGNPPPPAIEDMKACVRHLYQSACARHGWKSTGGFSVRVLETEVCVRFVGKARRKLKQPAPVWSLVEPKEP